MRLRAQRVRFVQGGLVAIETLLDFGPVMQGIGVQVNSGGHQNAREDPTLDLFGLCRVSCSNVLSEPRKLPMVVGILKAAPINLHGALEMFPIECDILAEVAS